MFTKNRQWKANYNFISFFMSMIKEKKLKKKKTLGNPENEVMLR